MTHETEVLNCIINQKNTIFYYGDSSNITRCLEIMKNGTLFEGDHPDLCFCNGDDVLIVEHFEFDAYSRSVSKGSQYRREEARIDRDFGDLSPSENGSIRTDIIRGKTSYAAYIKNLLDLFEKHSSEIEGYKEHLRELGVIKGSNNIKVLFFIEDVNPLGSFVSSKAWDEDIKFISPAKDKEFLAMMEKHPEVNYVLSTSSYEPQKNNWFIDSTQVPAYILETIDYATMDFIPFTPHVISDSVCLEMEEKKEI